MKKTLTLFLPVLFFAFALRAQDSQDIEFTRNGCQNTATVKLNTENITVFDNLYLGVGESCPAPYTEKAGITIGGVHYILERKSGLSWTTVTSAAISSPIYTFNNLQQNAIYRVRAEVRKPSEIPVADITRSCLAIGWKYVSFNFDTYISNELEFVDVPVPVYTLLDFSGEPFNNCIKYVPEAPVYIDGSATFGETEYLVQITMRDEFGNYIGWNSTGWMPGPVGYIDVLNDVWQLNHPDWQFWAGYFYEIYLCVKNTCDPWEQYSEILEVRTVECRTASDSPEIVIFPNPASVEIRFTGLQENAWEDQAEYTIHDLSGRVVGQGILPGPTMPVDVSNLPAGLYVIRLIAGEVKLTEKISILR